MTNLKPGDKVTCRIKNGKIVSPYSAEYDDEKDFEIVASDASGYFLYVPYYFNLSGTANVTQANVRALNINNKFLDCEIIYIVETLIYKVHAILDGLCCITCKEFRAYSEPNMDDGTFKCWSCKRYPLYR